MSRVNPTSTKPQPASNKGNAGSTGGTATATKPTETVNVDKATEKAAKTAAKKEKIKRVFHPLLQPKMEANKKTGKMREVTSAKLDAIPDDYDPAKRHRKFLRTDFNDESLWFELEARSHEAKAAELRKQGENLKVLGTAKDRKDFKRWESLERQMDALRDKLAERGVDTSRLDAKIKADKEAAKAAKTEKAA